MVPKRKHQVKNKHPDKLKRQVECPVDGCSMKTNYLESVKRHIKNNHPDTDLNSAMSNIPKANRVVSMPQDTHVERWAVQVPFA